MPSETEKVSIRTPEVEALLQVCFLSTKATAKVLFPERFYLPFSPLHDKIFSVLDDDRIQQVVIAAPRGFGKTSIINLAYPAKKILFREKQFIVPISSTATQAILQGENLKRELVTNPVISRLFGPMKTDMFSKEQWITETGTMILPRGSGQQVRGILYGNARPQLILVDDVEDSETVQNEEQRRKTKEWFFADVLNSVNRAKGDWKVVVGGTLLHEDSLLANLLEDPNWHPIHLELFDDNYESNWPEFMSKQKVVELVDKYRTQGLLDVLYREYRNLSISTEDATFLQSYFKYHDPSVNSRELEHVVVVDPAKTVKLHSAESAIVGVGLDLINNKINVDDLIAGKFHPDELVNKAIEMCLSMKSRVLGVEVTSLNEFITYPLRNELIRRMLPIDLVELHARGKKEDRIAALVPFYRRGQVSHNKLVTGPLEAQLLSFPRSKRWDCMDALAYVIEMLEQGQRYFFSGQDKATEEEFKSVMGKEDIPYYPEDDDFGERITRTGSWRTI